MDTVPSREIADMKGAAALPRKNGELVFDEAWQGRIFGMTVAMSHDASFEWREFQAQLIAEIAHEQLLADKGLVDPAAVAERTREFETGRRDDVF
jgi:hypothetical protein